MFTRRSFVEAAILGLGAALRPPAARTPALPLRVFRPEAFGAKGDGISNDSRAFATLADAVNANGGGTVMLRKTVYVVGHQARGTGAQAGWAYAPARLLELRNCSKPVVIEGNGAVMRCAAGLRFGTFDRTTGSPSKRPMPNYSLGELAAPYSYMILVENCTGPVVITDVELDGNLPHLVIGGGHGDVGWQISASGIFLRNNRGDEILRNVHSHHHPQDGLIIDGVDDEALAGRVARHIDNLRAEYNGRQGCSIVAGHGYAFTRCRFNHTGRSLIQSPPGAGVDIEAETEKRNRNFIFTDCEFSDNVGCGLVADSGDSADAQFRSCTFVGTTSWSAWPSKPGFVFDRCRFVGAIVHAYGDKDAARAAQFRDCYFTDDRKLSPTGKVFVPGKPKPNGPIADVGDNTLFNRCSFRLLFDGQLPWSWRAIYQDCKMEQRAAAVAVPRGKYVGFSTISGAVDLYNSKVVGVVVLNGKRYEKMQFGGPAW